MLTIGTQILEVTDLAGGVIVDSESCECFDLTETACATTERDADGRPFPRFAARGEHHLVDGRRGDESDGRAEVEGPLTLT